MINQEYDAEFKRSQKFFMTVKKILLRQLFLFPLCLFTLLPVYLFISFVYMFGSASGISIGLFVLINVIGILCSMLFGFLLSSKFRYCDSVSPFKYKIMLFAPLFGMTAIIAFINIFSENGAIIAAFILNPIASPLLATLLLFDKTLIPTFVILCVFSYDLIFWLTMRRCYKSEPEKNILTDSGVDTLSLPIQKKLSRKFQIIFKSFFSILLCLCLIFCIIYQYPEMEYKIIRQRFEMIEFSEDVDDYDFRQAFPFQNDNILAKLDEPSTLLFYNLDSTPKLDGATAFYPVYSAFAQAAYPGFESFYKTKITQNQFYDGYNLFLYPGNDGDSEEYDILSCTKTNTAYDRLINKKVDMIFAFEPSKEQLEAVAEKNEKMVLTPIGYDAFCFFVNTKNPVNNLTVKQIKEIFSGKTTNWKSVGGKNKRIFAFTRPNGSGSQTIMENTVMQGEKISLQYQARSIVTMGGAIKVVDSYINSPIAIGYTFMYYSSAMVTSDKIKYLSVNNIAPTPESVRNGTYIFSQPFYAITLESNKDANTAAFLDWITTAQGQEIIAKTGYLAL